MNNHSHSVGLAICANKLLKEKDREECSRFTLHTPLSVSDLLSQLVHKLLHLPVTIVTEDLLQVGLCGAGGGV